MTKYPMLKNIPGKKYLVLKGIPCQRYSDATPEEKIIRTLEIKREAEAIVQLFKVRFKERTKYQEFVRYSKKNMLKTILTKF